MKLFRPILLIAALMAIVSSAHAQLTVDLTIKRSLFIAHEPIIATVTITNLSGRDVTLADTPEMQWFGFQVTGAGERIYPPRNPNYGLEPLEVKAGGQMRRTVNLNELYEVGEYGIYRVRANIYLADLKKFYSSRPKVIEITDGRLIWSQVVGVPDGMPGGGTQRKFSLLAHPQGQYNVLYVRVEDRENGAVYCTQELGRLIDGQPPQPEFDQANQLYVLQLIGQRDYILTKITQNGELAGVTRYSAPKSRPYFRRLADGQLQIVGARRETTVAQGTGEPPAKLSARPKGMPAN